MLTRRLPGVYLRGTCVWLYVRGSVLIGMSLSVRSIGQCREISKRLEPREEEVGTAPDGGERWQSDDLLSHWTFGDLELQRAVLGADDRIALVAEFVEISVVDPHILSELVLANQAGAEHERRDAPLHAVVGGTFRQVRAVSRATGNHAPAVHVHGRIAGIHATDVRAKWHGIAVRILMFVVEVVVPLRIGAQCRIVFVGREHKWRAAAPPAHEFGRDEFLFLGGFALLVEEVAKSPHMFFEAAIRHIAAVVRKNRWLRQMGGRTLFVRIAEDELAGFQRRTGARCRLFTAALDHWLRQPITVAEVIVRILERRCGRHVQRRQHSDAVTSRDQLFVLGLTASVFGGVASKENHDGMEVRAGQTSDPVVGMIRTGIANHLGPSDHPLFELVGKRRQRRLLHTQGTQAVPCKSNGDPALILLDRILGLRGRLRSLENCREPSPTPSGIPKRQKLVPASEGRRTSQKNVLDVIEFEHDLLSADHCIWSSISPKAAFSLSAFLISSALTYGYSPYSRKLGRWCSRTNLMKAGAFVFQSCGKPSRFSKTVSTPDAVKIAMASSVYLSKSVSKMPAY